MAKDKITEYDATAANNTDVGGVNLAENSMNPSDVNNAIREVLSHQKEAFGSGTPLFVDQTNNRVGVNKTPTVALDVSGQAIITTADNTAQLTLISTDADANSAPLLEMKRDSSSPADNDLLGSITFKGENSASEEITYAKIQSKLKDATDGTEDGNISCEIMIDGTLREAITVTRDSVVINQDSQDIDFRVESDNLTDAFFINGANGNVGIGTDSPDTNLDIEGTGDCTLSITAGSTSHDSKIDFVHGSTIDGGITYDHNGSFGSEVLSFRAGNNGSHMFLDGNGTFKIGTTETNVVSTDGRHGLVFNHNTSTAATGPCQFSANGNATILQNRDSDDGNITIFFQNANQEGTITVSGSTISYNSFSGSHWSRLSDNSKPTILKGTVIETIDEMCDWYQAVFQIQEEGETRTTKQSIALPSGASVGDTLTVSFEGNDYTAKIAKEPDNKHTKCKISDTADSKRVYGVYSAWDNDDDTVNDMYVTAVGTHVVRVNKDVTVQAGDLLSSNGDGTAKVQDDDIIRSKTIGKVLTNIKQETYDDGSYTVPCALYCG